MVKPKHRLNERRNPTGPKVDYHNRLFFTVSMFLILMDWYHSATYCLLPPEPPPDRLKQLRTRFIVRLMGRIAMLNTKPPVLLILLRQIPDLYENQIEYGNPIIIVRRLIEYLTYSRDKLCVQLIVLIL
jgi:hypothetical protein